MATFIKHSERVEMRRDSFVFDRGDGSGYGFDATPDGDILLNWEHVEIQAESYLHCLSEVALGKMRVVGHQVEEWSYRTDPIIECNNCRRAITLYGFTNTCECGVEYNMSGQQLAPRSQWEDEDRYAVEGPQNYPDDYDGDY